MVQTLLTPLLLKAAMPQASECNRSRFLPDLLKTAERYGITSPLRLAHFLAQVAQESGQLTFTEEIASGAAYEGRSDLGNVEPGDGTRFKGRGLLQITGRSNYRSYSLATGQDLLSGNNPSRLAKDTGLATDVAGWFWQLHGLNALADANDLERITRRINGGLNGLARRQAFFTLATTALDHAERFTALEAHVSKPPATKTPGQKVQLSASAAKIGPRWSLYRTTVEAQHAPLSPLPIKASASDASLPRLPADTQFRSAA